MCVLPCFDVVWRSRVGAAIRSHKTRSAHVRLAAHTYVITRTRAATSLFHFASRARRRRGSLSCLRVYSQQPGRARRLLHACAPAEWPLTLSCSMSFSSYRDNFAVCACGRFAAFAQTAAEISRWVERRRRARRRRHRSVVGCCCCSFFLLNKDLTAGI